MKILRVINNLNTGGAERSLETNVPIHISNGYEMDVLVLDGTASPFMKSLKEKNVRVFSTGISSLYNPLQIIKIARFIKKYDIVHVHLFPALYWVAIAKMVSRAKCHLVFTEHSTENRRRNNPIFRLFDRFIYKRYERIIAISDATCRNLSLHLGDDSRITTIPNGVDLRPYEQQYDKLTIDGVDKDAFIITQIASFRRQKDQDTTIKSLQFTNHNVHAVFAGVGDRLETCRQLARDMGLEDRVHFLGSRMDIPAIVKSSDVVVMSSNYEGFGRAAIEGMAGRKPTIATNVAGLRDVVGGAGLLFEVGDARKLAENITRLQEDGGYYNMIADKCYNRAQEYSATKMIEGYERIYKKWEIEK